MCKIHKQQNYAIMLNFVNPKKCIWNMHISFKFPFKGYENINCGLTHIFSFNQKNMKKYENILAKKNYNNYAYSIHNLTATLYI